MRENGIVKDLWVRNGGYYARIAIEGAKTGKAHTKGPLKKYIRILGVSAMMADTKPSRRNILSHGAKTAIWQSRCLHAATQNVGSYS
jgi:hypothetical protein